ncbi:hypothetical protein IFM89_023996 [Coptis chinensis]|uniref:Uncharacterized protein n=1 Tax=Coptis chinensis TaxID=261450 RepID=A0A835HAN6_9MAGN|nr:hypothetical protein IFM89_023996 [Coptis chinensis]
MWGHIIVVLVLTKPLGVTSLIRITKPAFYAGINISGINGEVMLGQVLLLIFCPLFPLLLSPYLVIIYIFYSSTEIFSR